MLPVQFIQFHKKDYKSTWDYQEELLQQNVAIKQAQRTAEIAQTRYDGADTKSYFILVEHPHVYTLGKSGHESNLLIDAATLAAKNIAYFKTNRGGDITYHGPGQIVGYPILDLEKIKPDIVWYMRTLEEMIIDVVAAFGITAGRLAGATGVWLDSADASKARKICAMGVRTSRWVTMHGFALNVNTDLSYFNNIIPCGIDDKAVTSMAKELGKELDYAAVQEQVKISFAKCFGVALFV